MPTGQSDDNELQKAIDDITRSAVKPGQVGDPASEIEAKLKTEAAANGATVVPPKVELSPISEQSSKELERALENATPVMAAEDPAQPEAVLGTTEDLEVVKKEMLRELFPLMDKINLKPEQKFRVYREMIESTQDKGMVAKAYESARMIENEQQKGEALVFLLEQLDN